MSSAVDQMNEGNEKMTSSKPDENTGLNENRQPERTGCERSQTIGRIAIDNGGENRGRLSQGER